jgi:hypothetical protein
MHGLVSVASRKHNPVKSEPRQRTRPEVRARVAVGASCQGLGEDPGHRSQEVYDGTMALVETRSRERFCDEAAERRAQVGA